jgi:hypothetical protein
LKLTTEELQKILDKFDEQDLKSNAVFGVFHNAGASDQSFIRANKEGLELFAIQLLKASRDAEKILSDKEKTLITLDYSEEWIDENSDTIVQYIEPIAEKLKMKSKADYKEGFAEKLIPFGCITILILLCIATLIGLKTILEWIF